jgi:hypothetical protein
MEQEILREKAKMMKWKYDVDYRTIAEDVLGMNYNSFLNFVNGYKELGRQRGKILEDYISNYVRGNS